MNPFFALDWQWQDSMTSGSQAQSDGGGGQHWVERMTDLLYLAAGGRHRLLSIAAKWSTYFVWFDGSPLIGSDLLETHHGLCAISRQRPDPLSSLPPLLAYSTDCFSSGDFSPPLQAMVGLIWVVPSVRVV